MKTIKQRISYAVMGLMAMGFTACTQNEDMAPTLKGQEINATFSVGGMQTRVNTLGHGNSWENEDLISVQELMVMELLKLVNINMWKKMGYTDGNLPKDFAGKKRKDAN